MFEQMLMALGCCLFSFGVSHISWLRRRKKEGEQAIPLFWERPLIALMLLVGIYKFTEWPGDIFALWMIGWYFLFLIFYTWYLYRVCCKNTTHQKYQEESK